MTVDAFLAWDAGDGSTYELVDGEPRAMAPASNIHAFLQSQLGSLIWMHLQQTRNECVVLSNPGVIPRLMSAHNVRIPDLGVTCVPVHPGQATLSDPVLLIELLSPGNQAETWANVWAYTSISTVQEILVLHTSRIGTELLQRAADGAWSEKFQENSKGHLLLESIGFRVSFETLYARTGL